jgi:hypothetical protein
VALSASSHAWRTRLQQLRHGGDDDAVRRLSRTIAPTDAAAEAVMTPMQRRLYHTQWTMLMPLTDRRHAQTVTIETREGERAHRLLPVRF